MDPKRLRLIVIAAAIPLAFVALVSVMGSGGGGGKKGAVVVVNTQQAGSGSATPRGTPKELTLADLMKSGPVGTGATPTPTLPPTDPKVIDDLMDKGGRAYLSSDLTTARGYYAKAVMLDPKCERCRQKLELLEKQMLNEIEDAFRAGENYLKDGRYDQAIWSLERVLVLDPDPKSQKHENAKTLIEDAKTKKAQNSR